MEATGVGGLVGKGWVVLSVGMTGFDLGNGSVTCGEASSWCSASSSARNSSNLFRSFTGSRSGGLGAVSAGAGEKICEISIKLGALSGCEIYAQGYGLTVHYQDLLCGPDRSRCLPQGELGAYPAEQRILHNRYPWTWGGW